MTTHVPLGMSPGPPRPTQSVVIGWAVFVQIVGWIVAAMLTYAAIAARVAVVEDRVNTLKADVAEMKADIKTLLKRP